MTTAKHSYVPPGGSARGARGHYTRPAGHRGQEDAGAVALLCYREASTEFTWWASKQEAEEAMRDLVPCDGGCANSHAVAFFDTGRWRVKAGPARTVLAAAVVAGSWRIATHLRLVDCPFCGAQHPHSLRHIGSVRVAGCGRGFYRIVKEEDDA